MRAYCKISDQAAVLKCFKKAVCAHKHVMYKGTNCQTGTESGSSFLSLHTLMVFKWKCNKKLLLPTEVDLFHGGMIYETHLVKT